MATAVLGAGHVAAAIAPRSAALPLLLPSGPSRVPVAVFSWQPRLVAGAQRFSSGLVRASSEDTSSSIQGDELLADLREKWDNLENKSAVFLYGGGAVVAVWLSSIVVGAINSVPLLPKIMELVGLGYTGWFVYRYLLFKSSRKELAEDIEALKKKIAGTE